jgi:hypothetical protein
MFDSRTPAGCFVCRRTFDVGALVSEIHLGNNPAYIVFSDLQVPERQKETKVEDYESSAE